MSKLMKNKICNRCLRLKRRPNVDCSGTGIVHPAPEPQLIAAELTEAA
jgi:hypothetical protein